MSPCFLQCHKPRSRAVARARRLLAPHSNDQQHAVLPRPGLAPKPLLRLCPFQLRLLLLPLLLLLLLGQQFLSLLELLPLGLLLLLGLLLALGVRLRLLGAVTELTRSADVRQIAPHLAQEGWGREIGRRAGESRTRTRRPTMGMTSGSSHTIASTTSISTCAPHRWPVSTRLLADTDGLCAKGADVCGEWGAEHRDGQHDVAEEVEAEAVPHRPRRERAEPVHHPGNVRRLVAALLAGLVPPPAGGLGKVAHLFGDAGGAALGQLHRVPPADLKQTPR